MERALDKRKILLFMSTKRRQRDSRARQFHDTILKLHVFYKIEGSKYENRDCFILLV